MLKEIAHILTSPINQAILLVLIALILHWRLLITAKTLKVIVGVGLTWLYLCSQPFFSTLLTSPLESEFAAIKANDKTWQNADAIWVLGCYHYNKEELPDVSRWNHCSLQRLVHAFQMYQERPTKIILTGGRFSNDESFSYATQAKQFLVNLGVLESDILAIDEGSNTQEELTALMNANAVEQSEKIAIVSSISHGRRLHYLMNSQTSIEYQFVPVDHLNVSNTKIDFGWPQLQSLKKSQRAIYAYMANIELWLFY